MTNTFVFYDFETTGTHTAFDQPLQFAAIATDENLNELERVDLRCQLAPHILPSPFAMHVTGVKPKQLLDKNFPNYFEFAQTIQALTEKWAPACWLGYNTIAFDEQVLRQMFYQNLQPNIYATQIFGNVRQDLMKMVFAVYADAPEILKWPVGDNGKINFKLDRLAPINGFSHENAHDALNDVEATIFIFKLIKERAPKLFQNLMSSTDKHFISSQLKQFKPMSVSLRFGGHPPKNYVGCYCGESKTNSNQIGFLDFEAVNISDLQSMGKEEITTAVLDSPKLIRAMSINKAETFREIIDPTDEILEKCDFLRESRQFQMMVSNALDSRFEPIDVSELEVEEKIYSGFFDSTDRHLLDQFQKATWPDRAELIKSFKDDRLRQLGQRLLAFYAPELLSNDQKSRFTEFLQARWKANGSDVKWNTIDKVSADLSEMDTEFNSDEWKSFYNTRLAHIGLSATL